ncbi:hypothetical protein BDN70DRAFT_870008 [Pholiota conissans]|uniref:Uncharacterized protein n=1 Tax=Pholiota conissans TaxID=109636 RepID=A0A9P5ZG25_9AGAR|nr:hypothetical protein BDN70DRAFT_870008 [Pholiota conissans]
MRNNIRCNYFDNDGKLLNPKHLRHLNDKCSYAHPDTPAWNNARPSIVHRRPSPDFNSDAWAPDGPSTNTSSRPLKSANEIDLAPTGRVWGKSNEERTAQKRDSQPDIRGDLSKHADALSPPRADTTGNNSAQPQNESSTSWADTLSKAAEKGFLTSTWGSNNGQDGWGSAAGSWGATNATGNAFGKDTITGSVGWGNSGEWDSRLDSATNDQPSAVVTLAGGQDTARDNGGWDTQSFSAKPDQITSNAPWGDANKGPAIDKGRRKDDIIMRDPSPLKPPPSVSTPSFSSRVFDNHTMKLLPDISRLATPHGRSAFSPAPSMGSTSTTMSKPSQRPVMKALAKLPFAEAARIAITGDKEFASGASSPPSPSVQKSYKGFKGRIQLYTDIVSSIQEVVVFEVVLQRMQAEDMRWKRMQTSEIYAHPTMKTRSILEAQRVQSAFKLNEVKAARDRALKHLAKLPELPTMVNEIKASDLDKDTIHGYTIELKEWLRDLEEHQTLLKERQKEQVKQVKLSNAEPCLDGQPNPEMQSLQSILQQEPWSWNELKAATAVFEAVLQDAEELVLQQSFTKLNELCSDPMDVDAMLPTDANYGRSSTSANKTVQNLILGLDVNEQKLQVQVAKAAKAILTVDELQQKIKSLREERKKMDTICNEVEAQFSEFDQCKENKAVEIQALTEQIQNLSLHPRPAPQSTPLSPIKVDELLDYIHPIIVQHVKDDLMKILQNLFMRCQENQELVAQEIDKMLKPVLASTELICQHASTST